LFHCIKVYQLSKLAKNTIIDSEIIRLSIESFFEPICGWDKSQLSIKTYNIRIQFNYMFSEFQN